MAYLMTGQHRPHVLECSTPLMNGVRLERVSKLAHESPLSLSKPHTKAPPGRVV